MHKSLNDINQEDLQQCKELASALLTPKEIAIALEIDIAGFVDQCQDDSTEIYRSFMAGRLLTIAEIRSSVIKLAKAGSSPAQTMSMDMIKHSELKLKER